MTKEFDVSCSDIVVSEVFSFDFFEFDWIGVMSFLLKLNIFFKLDGLTSLL